MRYCLLSILANPIYNIISHTMSKENPLETKLHNKIDSEASIKLDKVYYSACKFKFRSSAQDIRTSLDKILSDMRPSEGQLCPEQMSIFVEIVLTGPPRAQLLKTDPLHPNSNLWSISLEGYLSQINNR